MTVRGRRELWLGFGNGDCATENELRARNLVTGLWHDHPSYSLVICSGANGEARRQHEVVRQGPLPEGVQGVLVDTTSTNMLENVVHSLDLALRSGFMPDRVTGVIDAGSRVRAEATLRQQVPCEVRVFAHHVEGEAATLTHFRLQESWRLAILGRRTDAPFDLGAATLLAERVHTTAAARLVDQVGNALDVHAHQLPSGADRQFGEAVAREIVLGTGDIKRALGLTLSAPSNTRGGTRGDLFLPVSTVLSR